MTVHAGFHNQRTSRRHGLPTRINQNGRTGRADVLFAREEVVGRVGGVERARGRGRAYVLLAREEVVGRVGGVERTYSLRERKSLGAWAGSSGRVKSLLPPPYVSISGEFSSRSTDICRQTKSSWKKSAATHHITHAHVTVTSNDNLLT